MAITIEDIAREAGVSIATVSRVMNNTKAVSGELKDRVNAVIEKNNFKPNALARSLITKKTQVIGVMVPDISGPTYGTFVKGIYEICQPSGYMLMVCETKEEVSRELELLKSLEDKNADGVILVTKNPESFKVPTFQPGYPVVLATQGSPQESYPFHAVIHNDRQAAYDATEFLLQYGHRDIAFIGRLSGESINGDRCQEGYEKALHQFDIRSQESMIVYGDGTLRSGYECMKKIMRQKSELPSAIVACNDYLAMGAIRYLYRKGFQVPEDISVISMNDMELDDYYIPRLTSVKIPYYEEGRKASQLLLELIRGAKDKEEINTFTMEHKIMERDSVVKYSNKVSNNGIEYYLL